MSELESATCMVCDGQLYDHEIDGTLIKLYLTYCDNDKCPRYKLVTLQEDV